MPPTPRTIDVGKQIAPFISSRDLISNLRPTIEKAGEVVLDFKNVSFISRSAAHELTKLIETPRVNIRIVNANENIRKMIVAAKKPLTTNRTKKRRFHVKKKKHSKPTRITVVNL